GLSLDDRPTPSDGGLRDVAALSRSLSAERAELERRLSQRSEAFRALQAQARVGADEVRAALPRGTALLDYIEYTHLPPPAGGQRGLSEESRLLAFVARPEAEGVAAVPLGPSQALADLIDRWRASHGAGKAPPGGGPDPGAALRQRLWGPLEKHLGGAKV